MSRAILKNTGLVGLVTLVSRITGMVRDVALAQVLGAGVLQDAFLVAFKIPSFLRRLFAEGAFSQSFVPVISEYRLERSRDEVRELVSAVAGTLGGVLLVLTAIGVVAAPLIILLYAPGFSTVHGKVALAASMLRWTFPYLLFISLTALFSSVLNSYQRFFLPAFTQTIMNLVLIGFAVGFAAHSARPGVVLAIGVFVAGCCQLAIQLPAVARLGLLDWPRWRPRLEGVRRIGRLMLPGIFGSSMAQVSLVLNTIIASFLVSGSVSWLYFSDRLMEFPLGVFSVALATVMLPGLATQHARRSTAEFSATLDWALRLTLLLVTPAAVGLFCFAIPITATVFGYRRFNPHDVAMSAYALMAYAWGLLAFSLVKVLAPGYFARQDTRTPVRAGVIALACSTVLNIVVVLPAWRLGFPLPHVLLAASTGIGSLFNTWLLWHGLHRDGVLQLSPAWRSFLPRLLAANLVMAVLLYWLAGRLADWLALPARVRVVRCLLGILAGAAVYCGALFLFGMRYRDMRTRPV